PVLSSNATDPMGRDRGTPAPHGLEWLVPGADDPGEDWRGEAADSLERILESFSGESAEAASVALAGGGAGLAVMLAWIGATFDRDELLLRAETEWNRTLHRLASGVAWPGLFSGTAGIGWAAAQLDRDLFGDHSEDVYEELDRALLDYLSRTTAPPVELIAGIAGIGVYALARPSAPGSDRLLREVLCRLEGRIEQRPGGTTWRKLPEHLVEEERAFAPAGFFNLGLSHGVPGVLLFLAGLVNRGVEAERAGSLLERSVPWLLAQADDSAPVRYAKCVTLDGIRRPSLPVAWCYGDLGVSVALLVAGRAVRRPDWEAHAVDLARRCAAVPTAKAEIKDHGLCHGAAGAAHLLRRLGDATGDETLRLAGERWMRVLLATRRADLPKFDGYFRIRGDETPDGIRWYADSDPGLLMGAAGVALVLASALRPEVPPAWDGFLGLGELPGGVGTSSGKGVDRITAPGSPAPTE
ncbi:MAG: lanthionine synthetase C family protein, partial [Gemmatimonadetes bacterium]|nr:lanthionine synthetase C family protein [Gemmatimonadota bacterium]